MTETFPAIPADHLMRIVDETLDYTATYLHAFGYYVGQGRRICGVMLADTGDPLAEVISAGCLGRSMGADQSVWVLSAISIDSPVGDPYLIMIYTDELGAQIMRRRRLAIYDDGTVGPAGSWEDRSPEESRFVTAASIPWMMERGDPAAIRRLLEGRGHKVLA